MRIVLLSSGGSGQQNDVRCIEQLLREWNMREKRIASIDRLDPVTFLNPSAPPQRVDIQFHIETPCRAAMPWARYNIVLVNPEWWPKDAWNWALAPVAHGGADLFLFRTAHGRSLFPDIDAARAVVLPWRCFASASSSGGSTAAPTALFLVGRSIPKYDAAKEVLPHWKASWPPLTVVTTAARIADLQPLVSEACRGSIQFRTMYETEEERLDAQRAASYHVLASCAEGYGYGFAEAAAVGALPLWYRLPVFASQWEACLGSIGSIPVKAADGVAVYRDGRYSLESVAALHAAGDALFALPAADARQLRNALRARTEVDRRSLREQFAVCMRPFFRAGAGAGGSTFALPPAPLPPAELPHVAVITLTRNRRRWFPNMVRNIAMSGYPRKCLTWVLVDDGDESLAEEVARFRSANPDIQTLYIPCETSLPIGEKRNRGIAAAPADCSVIVMMDDDDHYPGGSIARRVAWMKALGAECVYCSTLPMYHCGKFISAYNTPPLDLAPEARVSEATLCFKRTFWERRGFPSACNMAEGEAFLAGRIAETAEIHPSGVIVSFLHGANATSRRVPATTESNGCHYGFDDTYFLYLSGLATETL